MPKKEHLKMYKMVHKKSNGDLRKVLYSIISKLKKGRTDFTYNELYIAKTVKQSFIKEIQKI